MSEVQLVVREAGKDWSGAVHGSDADRAIAALSADPITLAELEAAATRFSESTVSGRIFGNLRLGLVDEPYDAGLVVLDLVARLVVVDSTYSSPGPEGEIWPRGQPQAEYPMFYHLADDWLFTHEGYSWQHIAEKRRRERLEKPAPDARGVIYGPPLIEFLAREALTAFQKGKALTPSEEQDAIKNIHAAWLMTPRDDLQGSTPREVMMAKREHISRQLQDRSLQWSHQGKCPAGLAETSFAYRYGGFGIHELVVYYGLVRFLLESTWEQLEERSKESKTFEAEDFLPGEIIRLEQLRDLYLDTPRREDHDRTPRAIIHNERRRVPEVFGKSEAMHDPDCPCCQMLGEMPGPMFWNLDGSSMDDEFAFDIYHRTLEEREAEERQYEEFNRRFNAIEKERERLGIKDFSPWRSSYSSEDTEVPLEVRVFGIGGHLAELMTDLRDESRQPAQPLIDQLNRDFGNLRELLNSDPATLAALYDPVIDRFVNTLDEVETAHPDLAPKCEDLTRKAKSLLEEQPPEPDISL